MKYFTVVKLAIIKKTKIDIGKDVEKRKFSHTLLGRQISIDLMENNVNEHKKN